MCRELHDAFPFGCARLNFIAFVTGISPLSKQTALVALGCGALSGGSLLCL
jgi:hypothetical protein